MFEGLHSISGKREIVLMGYVVTMSMAYLVPQIEKNVMMYFYLSNKMLAASMSF